MIIVSDQTFLVIIANMDKSLLDTIADPCVIYVKYVL